MFLPDERIRNAIYVPVRLVESYIEKKIDVCAGVCLIDTSEAFDTV